MQEVLKMNKKMFERVYFDTDSIKITVRKSVIVWLGKACDDEERERRQRVFVKYYLPKVQSEAEYAMYRYQKNSFYGIMCKGGFTK